MVVFQEGLFVAYSTKHLSIQIFMDYLRIVELISEEVMVFDEIVLVLEDVKAFLGTFIQCSINYYSYKCNSVAHNIVKFVLQISNPMILK